MDLLRGTELDTGTFLDKLKRQPTNEQVAYVEQAKESAKAAKEIDDAVEARDVDDLASRLTEWLSIEQQDYVASALDRLPAKSARLGAMVRRPIPSPKSPKMDFCPPFWGIWGRWGIKREPSSACRSSWSRP